MDVHYEWYRRRTFFRQPHTNRLPPHVLVLWLDDSFFEDEPLLHLRARHKVARLTEGLLPSCELGLRPQVLALSPDGRLLWFGVATSRLS
jgi:hypothetical protein